MKQSFTRRVTIRFVVALTLLVLFNLALSELQGTRSQSHAIGASEIEAVARERMLTTQSALLAVSLLHARNETERARWRQELLVAVEDLRTTHAAVIPPDSDPAGAEEMPPRVRDLYLASPNLLDPKLRGYIDALQALADSPSRQTLDEGLERIRDSVVMGDLVSTLDLAVGEYRKEQEASLASMQGLREWSLRINVLLLVALALFVFWPMAQQIRSDLRQLAKLNIILEQRVSNEKQAHVQLTSHANELARSNAELEQFASVASHDLQEPLRKILAFGDRLEQKSAASLDEEGLDYLRRMRSAAGRMQDLINGLLMYSRVSTRAQPFQRTDLSEVVKEVLTDLEARIEQVAARIQVDNLPVLDADPMQMRQLLQNLIGNALKFHRDDRPPVVKVRGALVSAQNAQEIGYSPHEKLCRITVEDNGVGFDPRHADRIFAVFQRLHSRKDYEGTGVGLAICRKIAERHGGMISAKSHPGQGAKFSVVLPLHQVSEEQAA